MRRPFRWNVLLAAGGWMLGMMTATCSRPVEPGPSQSSGPGLVAGALPAPAFAHAAGTAASGDPTLADIAGRVVASVVNVSATRVAPEFRQEPFFDDPFFRDFFGPMPRPGPEQSLGSGVIVSAEGVVLTNNHVIEHARDIKVKLHDGRELAAKVVGTDPKSDVAVLRLEGKVSGLSPLPFGDSDRLRLGDVVLAIGNPFGVGQTVTMGIVSGLGRDGIGILDYEDFIQTDAAINPGNSGGALVNMRGELVGINTAILSRSGGYQGVGFAIPSNMARPVLDALLRGGKVARGWMGVSIQDLDDKLAAALELPVKRGVLVSDVEKGSPAARAGLRRGDVVVSLNGEEVTSTRKLRNRIAAAGPGRTVSLEVVRQGGRRTLSVQLAELPDSVAGPASDAPAEGALEGVAVAALDSSVRRRLSIPKEVTRGVVVTGVAPASPAMAAGLRPGDVIAELNRKPIDSVAAFQKAYAASRDSVLLLVHRGEATLYIAVRR
ncbi:MAG TPA: Do family serine endopeptidase [Kofleriaceae bacterium]|nr:Do family serine endopeptidase [Kofleriaceae bacterium]